jgi:hypothetical protein
MRDEPELQSARSFGRGSDAQLTGRSKITAYRHERLDPNWPKPIVRGRRVFYKAADCKRYLQSAQPTRL